MHTDYLIISLASAESILTAGPIVVEIAIPLTYIPLLEAGLRRISVSKRAFMF